jgi:NADH-quinone oxidoreductase subunit M
LGEYADNRLVLGLAALGIIISAIFGLRAMARIFYGNKSDELLSFEKENKILDLNIKEIIPASLILLPLLFIGLWPKGISEGIDVNISSRYQIFDKGDGNLGLPSCCPLSVIEDSLPESSIQKSALVEEKK